MNSTDSIQHASHYAALISVAYLLSAALFILGLKQLSHPRTAVAGNTKAALAMLIAAAVTLLDQQVIAYELVIAGLVCGTLIGTLLAVKVEMTQMPQLVAAFNGFGGGASALVAASALITSIAQNAVTTIDQHVAMIASGIIGCVTLWGSVIAFCKLQGVLVPSGAVTSPLLKASNAILAIAALALATACVLSPTDPSLFWTLLVVSSILGITLVVPIGGADMPVVIALLNSYSGIAACGTGFVLGNPLLIIAGSLVGASGIILTQIMCKAMNRSLTNVLFGGLGAEQSGPPTESEEIYAGNITSSSPDEAAMIFEAARRVVIVPGYGMAVSQAQHVVRDLTNYLEAQGIEVLFAIHPVAGRMPGHMNVLLAEADIPYDKLIEMDNINPTFPDTDISLVIGANDVVNPLARTDPNSPISGMPILDVDKSRTVMVVKRSLSPGFAGIANPLFAADNTMMLFGDGKQTVLELLSSLKENAA